MSPDRWARIEEIYHAALESDPTARADFLAGACEGDDDLRREVSELLAYDDSASFIDAPALRVAARSLAGGPDSEVSTDVTADAARTEGPTSGERGPDAL